MQAYADPRRASDPHALPDVEIFEAPAMTCTHCEGICEENAANREDTRCPQCTDGTLLRGEWSWWWQSCFPGCMPDGDPVGPFDTEAEALADAQDME